MMPSMDPPLPYIGIKARLSQVLINQWSIIIIIMIVKLLLFKSSLNYSLFSLRQYSILACNSAQNTANSLSTLPQQLTNTANSLIANGIDQAVVGLISTVQLLVTGVQNLIIFSLEMLVGTYACLAVSLIDGTVDGIANATESVINFTNKELGSATDDLESGLQKISNALNDVAIFVSNIESFFTGDTEGINQVNLTISSLKNLQIPNSINAKLESLKQNTPDYDTVKTAVINEIKEPFNLLNSKLNSSLNDSIKFQPAVFNSPSNLSSMNICKPQDINEVFDGIAHDVDVLFKIFIFTLAALAVIICVPLIYNEYCQWRWLNACAEIKEDRSKLDKSPQQENMIVLNMSLSHWKVRIQSAVSNLFSGDVHTTLSRWFIDYVSYPPMINTLILGFCGVLIVILQFILLGIVKRELPKLESQVENITSKLVQALSLGVNSWIDDTNNSINTTESDINNNLLGWVETGTSSVNNTLTLFLSSMNSALSDTFQDTPLYTPISSVFQCVIGNKVDEVIKGLTWVHDKAQVSLPRINESLILGQSTVHLNETNSSNNTVVVAKTSIPPTITSLTPVVDKLIGTYEESLMLELHISISLIAVWILFAIFGLIYCYTNSRSGPYVNPTSPSNSEIDSAIYPRMEKMDPSYRPSMNVQTVIPEQGWKYNWFQPPSFLANDPNGPTPVPSPMMPSPLHTPVELKQTMPLAVKLKHPSMIRASTRAVSDYIRY